MSESQLFLFIMASLLVIITPGQDLMLVLSRGVSYGARAGVITAAGVSVGLLGHSLFAAFGLGTLLLASEKVFLVLKCVGAGYLFYLGGKLILSKPMEIGGGELRKVDSKKIFMTGAFSNISNPKITLFYFAFLPQFLSPATTDHTMYLFFMGVSFAVLTFIIKAFVGYFSGVLSGWFRSHRSVLRWVNRTSGGVLIALGVKLSLEQRM